MYEITVTQSSVSIADLEKTSKVQAFVDTLLETTTIYGTGKKTSDVNRIFRNNGPLVGLVRSHVGPNREWHGRLVLESGWLDDQKRAYIDSVLSNIQPVEDANL